ISVEVLFFTLEINKLDDADLGAKLKHGALRRYKPWLDAVRLFRKHQLSDEVERLLHEKHVAGSAAWQRLFDETMADMRFEIMGKSLTSNEALNYLTDRDETKRRAAGAGLAKGLASQKRLFALVTNTLAKDKDI